MIAYLIHRVQNFQYFCSYLNLWLKQCWSHWNYLFYTIDARIQFILSFCLHVIFIGNCFPLKFILCNAINSMPYKTSVFYWSTINAKMKHECTWMSEFRYFLTYILAYAYQFSNWTKMYNHVKILLYIVYNLTIAMLIRNCWLYRM